MSQVQEWETIEVRHDEDVVMVFLNRPMQRNAISERMKAELAEAWRSIAADRRIRAVILSAHGEVFSAGADRSEIGGLQVPREVTGIGVEYGPSQVLEVPVIVAVNGPCIGGALRLVADADIALAATSSWFADPHHAHGLSSGPMIGELSAVMQPMAAGLLILAGQRMSAADALRAGLVVEVVEDAALLSRAMELARAIADVDARAVRQTLSVLRERRRSLVEPWVEPGWRALSHTIGDTEEGGR